jgi:hypothetical protein
VVVLVVEPSLLTPRLCAVVEAYAAVEREEHEEEAPAVDSEALADAEEAFEQVKVRGINSCSWHNKNFCHKKTVIVPF